MQRGIQAIIYLTLIICGVQCFAQGPPIFTETPITLGISGGGIRTFGKYISLENAKVYVHPIIIPYNITTKLQAGIVGAFVYKNLDNLSGKLGFGDLQMFLKYVFFKKDGKAKTFRLALKGREIFPTGKTSTEPPIGIGAFQTYLGIIAGYVTSKYGVYADVGYNIVTKGLPNDFTYNLAVGLPLLPQRYPIKQLNIFFEMNGKQVFNINNHTLFLSPGIQYIPIPKFLLETAFQYAIINTVPKDKQIKYMVTLGFRILIF